MCFTAPLYHTAPSPAPGVKRDQSFTKVRGTSQYDHALGGNWSGGACVLHSCLWPWDAAGGVTAPEGAGH